MADVSHPNSAVGFNVSEGNQLSGRVTFDGSTCHYGDEIKTGDLVVANFDVKEVHPGGGLYLVEERQGVRVVWRGCRKMMLVPDGIAIDCDGNGDWRTFPKLAAVNWHVVGVVETVYKPTRYQ